MMPNLGQGGCQALEDAFELTNLLCEVTDKSQIPDTLQTYYRNRIVRSAIIQGMSRLSSDIIITAFSTPFRLTEYLKEKENYKYLQFKSIGTWYLQPFLPLIFYAQFGYLYSFAPSEFGEDEIKKMVEASVKRNKAEAEKIYSFLKEGYTTYFTAKTMSFMNFNKKTSEVSKIMDASELRALAEMSK